MSDGTAEVHRAFSARRPIDLDTTFFEAGFSSVQLAEVVEDLRANGSAVTLVDLYRYPTVRQLTDMLDPRENPSPRTPPWLR